MAFCRTAFGAVAVAAVLFTVILLPAVQAKSPTPAPAPAPTSDGTSIDQGIAYLLMLLALVLTYLIHGADRSYSF